MLRVLVSSAFALSVAAPSVLAGGVERTSQSVGVLFEEGRYLEFSALGLDPRISGVGGLLSTGVPSGDMAGSQLNFGAAYKADLNETWSYAIIYDQPYGADVFYPNPAYFAGAGGGSTADLESHAITGILQYNLPSSLSFYGGLRAQTLKASARVPFLGGYSADGERDLAFGYLAGVAYEKPEIALRVALTYSSEINHGLDTDESFSATPTVTEIETPKSVNLEFQSGVAEDTLVFGSIRWVDWTAFNITPPEFGTTFPGSSLVSYADDRTTYTLGIGRRLNETWSVIGSVSYEEHTGSPTGNLGPNDGLLGVAIGAVYTKDNMKITGGISYVDVGDAQTQVGAAVPAGVFEGNSALAAGIKVGFSF